MICFRFHLFGRLRILLSFCFLGTDRVLFLLLDETFENFCKSLVVLCRVTQLACFLIVLCLRHVALEDLFCELAQLIGLIRS